MPKKYRILDNGQDNNLGWDAWRKKRLERQFAPQKENRLVRQAAPQKKAKGFHRMPNGKLMKGSKHGGKS